MIGATAMALNKSAGASAPNVPKEVVRSLYRSVLREARAMDSDPLAKTLLPMPKKLQGAASLTGQLHMPGQISLSKVARSLFREKPLNLKTGFDALTTLRMHVAAVKDELPRVTQDREELTRMFDRMSADVSKYWAKAVKVPLHTGQALFAPHGSHEVGPSEIELSPAAKASLLHWEGFDLKVGHALVAHPLSSAHADRRVMLIVEKDPITTTALVLDMLYSYPLSHGNPMFPEVLWGHEVHNGGYCHVDFTMPPTANVSVLHTLEPPEPAAPNYSRWLQWTSKNQSPPKTAEAIRAQHEACCHPVIRGDKPGAPTLYYSKVEALPYLATLAHSQPRDALRVYWGCMKWSTAQLLSEVALGHWMPVEISPTYFGAYDRKAHTPDHAEPQFAITAADEKIECFPSEDQLKERKAERERHMGANLSPPQVFPPSQPTMRREALWDQIMHSLGGEFRCLVGCANPFANPRGEYARIPPIGAGTPLVPLHATEPVRDGGIDDETGFEDDDDDEPILVTPSSGKPPGDDSDNK